jgi:hypothetical protein
MRGRILFLTLGISLFVANTIQAQVNEDKLGAWYMYFFKTNINEGPWGVQGDVQYRNWNIGGDLEQLLLRGGLTYKPKNTNLLLTLGYGNITTGQYGKENATTAESRIYQEALFPVKFGNRVYTNHRFRYEQRFVEGQDARTRYRYNLFINIALNKVAMEKNTLYLALYNEVFINGQRDIGNERTVELFDRNRFYSAIGYVLKPGLNIQLGIMKQTTNNWSKSQLQLSLHHNF